MQNFGTRIILVLTLVFLVAGFHKTIYADEVIQLSKEKGKYDLSGQVSIFEDKQGNFNISEIVSPEFKEKFKNTENKTPNFSFSSSVYWVRITVQANPANQYNGQWLLEISHPVLDYVTLYKPDNGNMNPNNIPESKSGDQILFKKREIKHRNLVFKLPIRKTGINVFYLRVKSKSSIVLPITIWQQTAFTVKDHNEQYFLGLFYGMMLVMFLYNAFLYISLRDRAYLYYVGYLLTLGLLYYLSIQGLAYEYLWPESPMLADRVPLLTIVSAVIFMLKFSQHFLNTAFFLPRFHKLSNAMVGLCLSILILVSILDMSPASRLAGFIVPMGLLYILTAGIMVLKKGYRPARYFMLAWTILIIFGLIYALRGFGILPNNFITQNGAQFGMAVEVILLSLGLAYKIQLIRIENERALKYLKKTTEAYSRFVPSEFLQFLQKESIIDVELGDQTQKNMAVLFADIRDFTSLSETMTPKETFDFINSFMSRMGPIIRKHNGIIDKYIGDAIMALFPGKTENAVDAAIEMQQAIQLHNTKRISHGYVPIRAGIGIHTGPLMLGTIGESQRMDSTVISDAVNLASRMQDVTRIFKSSIAISGPSLYMLENPSDYKYRILGVEKVKGKQEPITVFEIMDGEPEQLRKIKMSNLVEYEMGVQCYILKDYKAALNHFETVLQNSPDDPSVLYYKQRLRHKLSE